VTDADAKLAYEANRSRYVTPERRHVQQIVFPDEAAARAASERIAKGLTFAALAGERNLKESDIDLGTLAKAAMVDPAIADAAFALKAGEVSAPVKGRFGTVLAHVLKIEPELVRPYEQVADEIKQSLALERARADVLKTYDKIEDERAGGRNLAEVAQKHNLKAFTFESVDRAGNGPDGQPIADLPKTVDLVSAAFASDVGVENDPLQADRSYVWYEVAGITPSRERNLDEVKERVAAQWRDDEIAKLLKAKTDAMVDKLKAGSKIADLAEGGLKVETAAALKRGNPTEAIPIKTLDAVFRTPKGAAGSAEGDKESVRFVFVVKDVSVPKLDMTSPEAKRLSTVLRQSYADTLLSQYIARLETDIGTSFNQSALDQAVGGATSN
jgi:peptidyl-prolyl cis-trans isomerase D